MPLRQTVESFASNTSMPGASKVVLSSSPAKRSIWVIIFVGAWIMFLTQTSIIIRTYFTYPKQVTVDMVYGTNDRPVQFPAITLCNMRGLDFYVAHKLGDFFERKRRAALNTSDHEPLKPDLSQHSDDQFVEGYSGFVGMYERSNHLANLTRSDLIANIDLDLLRKNVVSLEEFFVACQHMGKDYSEAGTLTEIDHPHYFRCFTYTPSGDKIRSGVANGWSAIVNTGSGMLVGIVCGRGDRPSDHSRSVREGQLDRRWRRGTGGGSPRWNASNAGQPWFRRPGWVLRLVGVQTAPKHPDRAAPWRLHPGQSVLRWHRAHEGHSVPTDRLSEDVQPREHHPTVRVLRRCPPSPALHDVPRSTGSVPTSNTLERHRKQQRPTVQSSVSGASEGRKSQDRVPVQQHVPSIQVRSQWSGVHRGCHGRPSESDGVRQEGTGMEDQIQVLLVPPAVRGVWLRHFQQLLQLADQGKRRRLRLPGNLQRIFWIIIHSMRLLRHSC